MIRYDFFWLSIVWFSLIYSIDSYIKIGYDIHDWSRFRIRMFFFRTKQTVKQRHLVNAMIVFNKSCFCCCFGCACVALFIIFVIRYERLIYQLSFKNYFLSLSYRDINKNNQHLSINPQVWLSLFSRKGYSNERMNFWFAWLFRIYLLLLLALNYRWLIITLNGN